MNLLGLEIATHSAGFDVDDAARPNVECLACNLDRENRLVETYRCAHNPGQIGV